MFAGHFPGGSRQHPAWARRDCFTPSAPITIIDPASPRQVGRLGLAELFQLGILWAHAMAAVAWVGGSLFYAVVLTPAVTELGPTPERRSLLALAGREFREVVRLAIVVFVVTGV